MTTLLAISLTFAGCIGSAVCGGLCATYGIVSILDRERKIK